MHLHSLLQQPEAATHSRNTLRRGLRCGLVIFAWGHLYVQEAVPNHQGESAETRRALLGRTCGSDGYTLTEPQGASIRGNARSSAAHRICSESLHTVLYFDKLLSSTLDIVPASYPARSPWRQR